ncbi:MAG: pyridoxal-dependent decarboxylase, exosortase A system-associated [Pseudomonadota bacterium]
MNNKPKPIHCKLEYFPCIDNQLLINNKNISQLHAIIGQTPFYAYDRNLIHQRIKKLKQHLPEQISLHYAIKANPFVPLVDDISLLVDGLDVASQHELLIALNSNINHKHISFAGPGKSDSELKAAIVSQVLINVESITELERIKTFAEEYKIAARIALRLNPDFELKNSGMRMSGGAKPFGIDTELLADIFPLFTSTWLDFEGFHLFMGSQNLRPELIIDAHNQIFTLVDQLIKQYQLSLKHLNIGGGFGIPYFPGDNPLELEPICQNLKNLIKQAEFMQTSQQSNTEIVIELGRYLVGEAGVYICQVVDIKASRGKKFVIVNGGLHHHLANSGNFGQTIRKNYPVVIANKYKNSELDEEVVTITGPLCTPLDLLAKDVLLPKCDIGDYFVVLQSGAYGKSASPENFLGQPIVKEILV